MSDSKIADDADAAPRERAAGSSSRFVLMLVCGTAFVAAALLLAFSIHGSDAALAWIEDAWALVRKMPAWAYFLSMAAICILPVPISPFYLAAGPLYGTGPSLVWIGFAVALNQIVAYTLAAGLMRPVIGRQLERWGYPIPSVRDSGDQWLFTFLIRAVPGVPYALQNWILGLAGIERVRYLVISWPIQMLYAIAWIVAGESAFEGRYGMLIGALSLILAIALLGRWVGKRARRARAELVLPTQNTNGHE